MEMKRNLRKRLPSPIEACRNPSWPQHHRQVMKKLCWFFEQQIFCDVVLKCGDYSVQAHSSVLAACSDYFEAMFSGDWAEAKDREVKLQGLTPHGLKAVLDYCYKGEIREDVAREKITEVVGALTHCQLVEACKDYQEDIFDLVHFGDLSAEHALWMFDLGETYGMQKLRENILSFIIDKLMPRGNTIGRETRHRAKTALVLRFNEKLIEAVLRKWDYRTAGLGKIAACELVVGWVQHDIAEREKFMMELLKIIWGSDPGLEEVVKYCREPIGGRLKFGGAGDVAGDVNVTVICSHIGHGEQAEDMVFLCFHKESNSWKQLPRFPIDVKGRGFKGSGFDVVDDMLFVVGGIFNQCGRKRALDYCYRYNPCLDSWEKMKPLPKQRMDSPTVVLDNKIFVVGGRDEKNKPTCAVDVFDPKKNMWSTDTPLPNPLFKYAVAAHNGVLYASGGDQEAVGEQLFLHLKPGDKAWLPLEPMPLSLYSHELIGHKDSLIAFFSETHSIDGPLILRYNVKTNTWDELDIKFDEYPDVIGAYSVNDGFYFWTKRELKFVDDSGEENTWSFFKILKLDEVTLSLTTCYETNGNSLAMSAERTTLLNLKLPAVVFKHLPEYKLTDGLTWEQYQRARGKENADAPQVGGGDEAAME